MIKLFQVLFLCHTVQIDNQAKERYQASSPDEFSFIKFCAKLGIVYEGEDKDPDSSAMIRKILFQNRVLEYKMLQVLEFDTTRKRMSVIVEDMQTHEIILLCKGAETSIFPRCTKGNVEQCREDIDKFARKGWRTLVISFKYLSKVEYQNIEDKLSEALSDVTNRNENLSRQFDTIESSLELIGATAVEDKLQENVADTLESLRQAGIKIWVLTGDKTETALNVSYSCKHFSNEMHIISCVDLKTPEEAALKLESIKRQ